MVFSYSFHISAKSHAVTNIGKIGQVSKHNLRSYKGKNYDEKLIETIVGGDDILADMEKIYHQEFDEALKKYNEGKRADRQIKNYMKHVSDSRSDVGVEIIIQIGDEEFWKDKNLSQKMEMTDVFEDQIKALNNHCPNFKVANATIHYDEKSPHMHVIGVPVADGYKKGLERQCSKTKIFTKDSLSFLQDVMRADMEKSIKNIDFFVDMELKAKEKGRNKDIPKASLTEFYELEATSKKLENTILIQDEKISANSEKIDQQNIYLTEGKKNIEKIDAITYLMAQKDVESIKADNYTIPSKKGFLGRIEEPERQGVFVEGMDREQITALVTRDRVDEGLERSFDNVQSRANEILDQAKHDATEIRAEATADRNEIIARANEIILQQNSIIQRATEWANNLKKRYNELVETFNELLGRKNRLEQEIADIESSREELEPLRKEVAELSRAKEILSGELDYELTKAKFLDAEEFSSDRMWDLRDQGRLLALYTDGYTRTVGRNENGGLDNKTLSDREKGLCRIGAMVDEERVRVPGSLLKELILARDHNVNLSQNLQNLIQQQSDVERVLKPRSRGR